MASTDKEKSPLSEKVAKILDVTDPQAQFITDAAQRVIASIRDGSITAADLATLKALLNQVREDGIRLLEADAKRGALSFETKNRLARIIHPPGGGAGESMRAHFDGAGAGAATAALDSPHPLGTASTRYDSGAAAYTIGAPTDPASRFSPAQERDINSAASSWGHSVEATVEARRIAKEWRETKAANKTRIPLARYLELEMTRWGNQDRQ